LKDQVTAQEWADFKAGRLEPLVMAEIARRAKDFGIEGQSALTSAEQTLLNIVPPDREPDEVDELLSRVASGRASEEEQTFVMGLVSADPDSKRLLHRLGQTHREIEGSLSIRRDASLPKKTQSLWLVGGVGWAAAAACGAALLIYVPQLSAENHRISTELGIARTRIRGLENQIDHLQSQNPPIITFEDLTGGPENRPQPPWHVPLGGRVTKEGYVTPLTEAAATAYLTGRISINEAHLSRLQDLREALVGQTIRMTPSRTLALPQDRFLFTWQTKENGTKCSVRLYGPGRELLASSDALTSGWWTPENAVVAPGKYRWTLTTPSGTSEAEFIVVNDDDFQALNEAVRDLRDPLSTAVFLATLGYLDDSFALLTQIADQQPQDANLKALATWVEPLP
jgi:hypothetical protein